jgi:hypothetical protein
LSHILSKSFTHEWTRILTNYSWTDKQTGHSGERHDRRRKKEGKFITKFRPQMAQIFAGKKLCSNLRNLRIRHSALWLCEKRSGKARATRICRDCARGRSLGGPGMVIRAYGVSSTEP